MPGGVHSATVQTALPAGLSRDSIHISYFDMNTSRSLMPKLSTLTHKHCYLLAILTGSCMPTGCSAPFGHEVRVKLLSNRMRRNIFCLTRPHVWRHTYITFIYRSVCRVYSDIRRRQKSGYGRLHACPNLWLVNSQYVCGKVRRCLAC